MPTSTVPAALDLAVLVGVLSSDPTVADLAPGSTLHRYEVTVRGDDSVRTVPVSWLDARRPRALAKGDAVVVVGAVQRRFFRAGSVTRSATEVAATWVGRADRRGIDAASRALTEAQAALGA